MKLVAQTFVFSSLLLVSHQMATTSAVPISKSIDSALLVDDQAWSEVGSDYCNDIPSWDFMRKIDCQTTIARRNLADFAATPDIYDLIDSDLVAADEKTWILKRDEYCSTGSSRDLFRKYICGNNLSRRDFISYLQDQYAKSEGQPEGRALHIVDYTQEKKRAVDCSKLGGPWQYILRARCRGAQEALAESKTNFKRDLPSIIADSVIPDHLVSPDEVQTWISQTELECSQDINPSDRATQFKCRNFFHARDLNNLLEREATQATA